MPRGKKTTTIHYKLISQKIYFKVNNIYHFFYAICACERKLGGRIDQWKKQNENIRRRWWSYEIWFLDSSVSVLEIGIYSRYVLIFFFFLEQKCPPKLFILFLYSLALFPCCLVFSSIPYHYITVNSCSIKMDQCILYTMQQQIISILKERK